MAGQRRIPLLAMVSILLAGIITAAAFGETARFREGELITGVVVKVDGNLLTVDGKTYDTGDVPVRFMQGMSPIEKPRLRGTRVEILVVKGKIHSVLVFPMRGQ